MSFPPATIFDLARIHFVEPPAKTGLSCTAVRKAARAITTLHSGEKLPEITLRGSTEFALRSTLMRCAGPVAEALALELDEGSFVIGSEPTLMRVLDDLKRDGQRERERVEALKDVLADARAHVISNWHTITSAAGWLIFQDRLTHEDFEAIVAGRMSDRSDYFQSVLWNNGKRRTA